MILVYVDPPHMLSSFQKWTLLQLNRSKSSQSGIEILKECCITAMDNNFQKKDAVTGLDKLEKMALIRKKRTALLLSEVPDPELSGVYDITADGIIYTKRMLKPVLDLLDDEKNIEKIAQKLNDGRTKSWLIELGKSAKSSIQQTILEKIITFGLGNISGLTQLLLTLQQNSQH